MKKESSLLQLILSLTLITLIAGAALAFVYDITYDKIAQSKEQKKQEAINAVLTGFDKQSGKIESKRTLVNGDVDSVTVHLAYMNDQLFGAAVETFTDKAFSGKFTIMVGFDAEGVVLGTDVLEHSETPGLGDKINKKKDENFSPQFVGMNPAEKPLKVVQDGGDVEAITAATISSRAFCDAVERAHKAFSTLKAVNADNQQTCEKEVVNE